MKKYIQAFDRSAQWCIYLHICMQGYGNCISRMDKILKYNVHIRDFHDMLLKGHLQGYI